MTFSIEVKEKYLGKGRGHNFFHYSTKAQDPETKATIIHFIIYTCNFMTLAKSLVKKAFSVLPVPALLTISQFL